MVQNLGEKEKNIVIRPVDYIMDSEENVKTPTAGSYDFSLHPYFNLSTNNLKLEPGQKKKVQYTIDIPDNVKGSRWIALYFEQKDVSQNNNEKDSKNKNSDGRQINVKFEIRYRTLILTTVNNTEKPSGKVVGLQKEENKNSFKLDFKNNGNVYYRASGRVDIRNNKGETVLKIPIEKFFVFPEQTRTVNIKDKEVKKLKPGEYIALAIIDYGGDQLVAGQLSFKISEN